eukprot:2904322-Pleurochrysis_carterae.AAC.4
MTFLHANPAASETSLQAGVDNAYHVDVSLTPGRTGVLPTSSPKSTSRSARVTVYAHDLDAALAGEPPFPKHPGEGDVEDVNDYSSGEDAAPLPAAALAAVPTAATTAGTAAASSDASAPSQRAGAEQNSGIDATNASSGNRQLGERA